ncbi:hypothetical protein LH128_02714, partial [Sphingomonas sp. LH128]
MGRSGGREEIAAHSYQRTQGRPTMLIERQAQKRLQGPVDWLEQPWRRGIRMAMAPALVIKHRQPGKYRAQAVPHIMRDMRQRPADRNDIAADPEVRQTVSGMESIAGGR